MCANDIALIADNSVERLLITRSNSKEKVKALDSFCQKWGMQVNLDKTKVILFRNGRKLSSKEKHFYNGKTIDIVTHSL